MANALPDAIETHRDGGERVSKIVDQSFAELLELHRASLDQLGVLMGQERVSAGSDAVQPAER